MININDINIVDVEWIIQQVDKTWLMAVSGKKVILTPEEGAFIAKKLNKDKETVNEIATAIRG